ncbi:radical SAM protein [Candidatus Woesearchaeota archaeon CG_4_10_14_0_2_um_filter_33_10]|nr:MAG: molybdenum cofactor biosynthesis protein MoaA [Candidatus Woesearchaeota archaeon CG10_big_fil_rev_8_21_14_0_10_33_12]PIU72370.1 MAG: radical SAM protein [Candidatus Woesearchaeota archaeon CG06_land_8_20_14_3_00_33_13]PIZ53443.1 MAG: radical SAM protein [Candidatus Woesearchaeota archaeon CG_4_10_14_0_2_um_filter_33_10]
MAELSFKTLSFKQEGSKIKVNFLKIFYFYLDDKLLSKIGDFKIKDSSIIFEKTPEKRAERKFNSLLAEGFKDLKNTISGKKTIYIHKNSGIPLIGSNSFGIVDRNTSIIDVRPITSCNLNCIFCSVDAGLSSRNQVDFVVEREYLVEEFKKLVDFKGCDVEVHLGTQGEPLLYAEIIELIKDLSSIKKVKTISMDTNGTLLTEELVDKLAEAGLTRINLSLNAMDKNLARKLAGCKYNLDKIKETASYIAKKMELAIAPVLVPGFNDDAMEKLINFAKKMKGDRKGYFIGIQNFLNYRFGRNPCKQLSWDKFYLMMKDLEKKTNTKLIIGPEDFNIQKTKKLPKPFKKGQIIKAEILCPGRLKNEMLAVASNRVISIPTCFKKGIVKIRITRTKHNIFMGRLV